MSKKIHIPNNCKRGLTTHILDEVTCKHCLRKLNHYKPWARDFIMDSGGIIPKSSKALIKNSYWNRPAGLSKRRK